jgi:diguanylate cyclase (GGDEF)-like protein
MSRSRVRDLALLIGVAVFYFVAAKLGLRLAVVNASATAVWPPAGIAFAAFLLLGVRAAPAIFAGAFLANVTTAGSLATSAGIAMGNTLEAGLGAVLVSRFAGGRQTFERARDVLGFALLAAVASTAVSATCGVTVLSLGGFADWADYGSIWLTWWLGDAAGVLIVAPVIVLWATCNRLAWNRWRAVEAGLLMACLLLVALVVFCGLIPSATTDYPLEFLCLPFLVWSAMRFGQREAATALLLLSGLAIRGTLDGLGPFARATHNESLLLLQVYMGVLSVTTLTLAALVSERRKVEDQLRHLAVTDPLTGVANYRRFAEALEEQVRRCERSLETFTIVLLDVDHLKKVNDRHGHLVGGRALCRVATALTKPCRASDTAARFGGDEFALVLPNSDETAAWQVAARVSEHLAGDGELPRISVSLGVAVYPRDGYSAEALLGAADRVLYAMKARGRLRARARA